MADHAGDYIEYWIAAPAKYAPVLYPLRKSPHLRMATAEDVIWIKGFTETDIESAEVLSIPMIKRYYLLGAQLYLIGKKLPELIAPALLWMDLRRGLKVSLPKENFNYFGVTGKHRITLVRSEEQRPTTASIIDLPTLGRYLNTAPRVRLAPLRWTVLEGGRAMVMGTPLLPITGRDFYQQACFLIPVGYKLRFETMAAVYQQALNESGENLYLLNEITALVTVRKSDFNLLSKGSFINSFKPQ